MYMHYIYKRVDGFQLLVDRTRSVHRRNNFRRTNINNTYGTLRCTLGSHAHTHILWKTIHGLSNRAHTPTLNTSIIFSKKIATRPKHIANCFTKQFTNTVKHSTHKTNTYTYRATHTIQGNNITLTTTQVQEAIKQSKNINSQGPDKLNIWHLNT